MKLVLQLYLVFLNIQIAYFFAANAIECKLSTGQKVAYTITVSQTGGGNFTTVAAALNSIPSGNDQWIRIALSPGTYREKIQINQDKQCIVLEGSDRSTTTITFDDHATTSESITFVVNTDNFVAKGITFKNSYNRALEDMNPSPLPAVALKASGDKHAYFGCGFEGYQDTLWDDKGRHYYRFCYIEGAVDFIWGSGLSIYDSCAINITGGGFITAQARESSSDPGGYLFRGCHVSGTGYAYLGRAYRPFSRVTFMDSYLDNVIQPEGWDIWGQQGHEGDITFQEINNTGPGADTSKRVKWSKIEAHGAPEFYTMVFIDTEGWIAKLPST